MAYLFSRACSRSLRRLSPVTTPGGTISVSEAIFVRQQCERLIYEVKKSGIALCVFIILKEISHKQGSYG
jgi:hypothetical protein